MQKVITYITGHAAVAYVAGHPVVRYFAGLSKTTVKEFVTVTGVITCFALIVAMLPLIMLEEKEAALNVLIAMVSVATITGIVGKEYFMNV